jgi:hypothetical protein
MAILCSFKQNGMEGVSQWRVAASCYNSIVGSGPSDPNIIHPPLNQQLPQNIKE